MKLMQVPSTLWFVQAKLAVKVSPMTKETVVSVKKLKTKYRVETTENKYSFTEDTIIKYSIFMGRVFEENELDAILAEEEFNVLTNRAINYLSYQPRSENEVRKYLLEKDATEELADKIIKRIKNLGYLDDEMLANSMLDYVIRNLKGPNVLRQKLTQKKLDEDLINKTIYKYTELQEEEVIDDLLRKIVERYKKNPKNKQKVLIYQKLIRDGFSSELVNYKLNKLEFVDESDERLIKDLKKLIRRVDEFNYEARSKIISKLMARGYEYNKILNALNNLEE